MAQATAVSDLTKEQAKKIETIIDGYTDTPELLISLLQDIQGELNYLPREALTMVSQKLSIPLSRVFSVATFFKAFSLKPRGKYLLTVCQGTACHVRGSQRLVDKLERDLCIESGDTTDDGMYTLETVACLGCCALAPVVVVNGEYESQVNSEKLNKILKKCK